MSTYKAALTLDPVRPEAGAFLGINWMERAAAVICPTLHLCQ